VVYGFNSTANVCYFYANIGAQWGSCTFTAATQSACEKAMSAKGSFRTDWDSSGNCTYVAFANGSDYSNF
jgi:hypothetical protein